MANLFSQRTKRILPFVLALILGFSSCFPLRSKVVDVIQLGMTQQEVRSLLGSPIAVSMNYNNQNKQEVSWFYEEIRYAPGGPINIQYQLIFVEGRLWVIDNVGYRDVPPGNGIRYVH